ncbi:anti-sigma regulatory factor [Brevifollis gellanilyticus]|uniref:Anti-sigma regulatory factor n=1 Tax=Brevifollis gellanilyticus TaxID=748831 RepID=A0A512M683_9BACT|nr:anti-sigma regulatory factor [Brevifollis gellanilyticus]GEP42247.1 anti-sigma regulatory factor [Brevifollis gellanilyticus]
MPTLKSEVLPVVSENDIVYVRQAVRKWAIEIKCSLVDQTKVVTAASELARNLLIYGGGGEVTLVHLQEGIRNGLRVIFADQGPGIPDIEQALKDGFTSGKGMGLGLGGAKRLVNEFDIESEVNKGTRITITKWR